MRLEAWESTEKKRPWKIVRTYDYQDVLGWILAADEASGRCALDIAGEGPKDFDFGPNGMRIVSRKK